MRGVLPAPALPEPRKLRPAAEKNTGKKDYGHEIHETLESQKGPRKTRTISMLLRYGAVVDCVRVPMPRGINRHSELPKSALSAFTGKSGYTGCWLPHPKKFFVGFVGFVAIRQILPERRYSATWTRLRPACLAA